MAVRGGGNRSKERINSIIWSLNEWGRASFRKNFSWTRCGKPKHGFSTATGRRRNKDKEIKFTVLASWESRASPESEKNKGEGSGEKMTCEGSG